MEVTAARRSFLCDIGFWADRTALHEAASHGRTLQLKQLIESGASVNMVTVDNITPLHEACIKAHPNCARLLLEAGAQVDVRTIHGSTPLCHACASGSLECAKLLLEYGANVNPSLTALTASPLHEACIQGAKVNSVRFHEIALHHAARVDMEDMVELLMEFGANAYASDNLGKKPVDYTAPGSTTYTCLMFYESNPLSLQQLCRITVRTMLGTRASEVIGHLDVSHRILNYLQYCDHPASLQSDA
ncbi:ankyrin repeat and SOCS box protein 13a.1 isoform X2 [Epinephelus lanceolatus]|uniref:ankyrin repeat and SOCS box protein 13a.1 isoform X2 n=1 Tax=Epinephelus lanceolatus TaxID=310571 RepID=UPI0014457A00|nr:ankyrin repeat and SOCS box protein 13a.1 isoform X2 [Epinephelus lanceolatus]